MNTDESLDRVGKIWKRKMIKIGWDDPDYPWSDSDTDEVVSLSRRTRQETGDDNSLRREGSVTPKTPPAPQGQTGRFTKQTTTDTSGIVSTSGITGGISSSLPDVDKICPVNCVSDPFTNKGYEISGKPNGILSLLVNASPKILVDKEGLLPVPRHRSGRGWTSPNDYGDRSTAMVNVGNGDENSGPRSSLSDKAGTLDKGNADDDSDVIVDDRDSSDEEDDEYDADDDEEICRTSGSPQSGDSASDDNDDKNPANWLERVPGENIIDVIALPRRVKMNFKQEQRVKKLEAVRQQYLKRAKSFGGNLWMESFDPPRQFDDAAYRVWETVEKERYRARVAAAVEYHQLKSNILKASNDRRAEARIAAIELPSETTWCPGYEETDDNQKTPLPVSNPERYGTEVSEESKSKLGSTGTRSRTVIQVQAAPHDRRRCAVDNDNINAKKGPLRRGMRALRNGLRRVGRSLHGLMAACTCSPDNDSW